MICGLLWRSWHVTTSLSHGTMILQRFRILLLHAYLYVTYPKGLTSVQTLQHRLWQQPGKPASMPVTVDCDVQESETKSAQLAKQDAELAAAKQESATRLAADKKEQAALQTAHHAILKASIHCAETCSIPHALPPPSPPPSPLCPFPHPISWLLWN